MVRISLVWWLLIPAGCVMGADPAPIRDQDLTYACAATAELPSPWLIAIPRASLPAHPVVETSPATSGNDLVLRPDVDPGLPTGTTEKQRLAKVLSGAENQETHQTAAEVQPGTAVPQSSFQLVPAPHSRQSNQMHLSSDWRSWAALGAGYTRLF